MHEIRAQGFREADLGEGEGEGQTKEKMGVGALFVGIGFV